VLVPELKIALHLKRDWSPAFPQGTRVIADRFRAEGDLLLVHVADRIERGRGAWLGESWFEGFRTSPRPKDAL
jgi:hypothetical protein